jgi:hypothetical protein
MPERGEDRCRDVVGPVWKLDGESWICELPLGHDGDHAVGDTWWTDPPEAHGETTEAQESSR